MHKLKRFDSYLNESISDHDMDAVKELIKNTPFLDLRNGLTQLGFKVDFTTEPLTMYTAKKSGQTLAILNKKYVEDPDFVHGDIAMGLMEGELQEKKDKTADEDDDMVTYKIVARDPEGVIKKLIEYIKKNGNTGHSFSIVVDPKSDTEETFGWDGDGGDHVESVEIIDNEKPEHVEEHLNESGITRIVLDADDMNTLFRGGEVTNDGDVHAGADVAIIMADIGFSELSNILNSAKSELAENAHVVSSDKHNDMLEVLPPIYIDSVEGEKVQSGFAVSEPNSQVGNIPTFAIFYKKGGKYYEDEATLKTADGADITFMSYNDLAYSRGNKAFVVKK